MNLYRLYFKDDQAEEVPNSARWFRLPNDPNIHCDSLVRYLKKKLSIYETEVRLRFGEFIFVARVYSNDRSLLGKLEEHFLRRKSIHSPALNLIEKKIDIVYLIDVKLSIMDIDLELSQQAYNAAWDVEKNLFVVAGIKHTGILKSAIIGSWSAMLLTANRFPVHASVLVSPEGKAVVFSGAANYGKTTTLIAAMTKLLERGYKVLTDDWALLEIPSMKVRCLDELIALRSTIIEHLPEVFPSLWMDDLIRKFQLLQMEKPEMLLAEAFGSDQVCSEGVVTKIVILHHDDSIKEAFIAREIQSDKSSMSKYAEQLAGHAYHCPNILKRDTSYSIAGFEYLLASCPLAMFKTNVKDDTSRVQQLHDLIEWLN